MNIIAQKNIFFLISALVIIPGIISLLLWGLRPAIDFTGGSKLEFKIQPFDFPQGKNSKLKVEDSRMDEVVRKTDVKVYSIQTISPDTFSLRTEAIDQKKKDEIIESFKKEFGKVEEKSFDTVGATIGGETVAGAIKAVIIASFAITLYIAYAFRQVSKPVESWKFGVAAIVALLHDVLIVVGAFSLLGHFLKVEVDSLFITALLTVMGFSVHDTIVVFDRIRENLRKSINLPFDAIVNNSILETLNRSLNTSITVILVLAALLMFGGETIRWFIVALLIGIISGTYSSIFNASPLLVLWYEFDRKRALKKDR